MKTLKLLAACVILSGAAGCASISPALSKISSKFENSISCSTDGTKAFFNSMYWLLGITSTVSDADSKAICNLSAPAGGSVK
jgi:hypothetical protein